MESIIRPVIFPAPAAPEVVPPPVSWLHAKGTNAINSATTTTTFFIIFMRAYKRKQQMFPARSFVFQVRTPAQKDISFWSFYQRPSSSHAAAWPASGSHYSYPAHPDV